MAQAQTWEQFNRFKVGGNDFYGVVSQSGEWIDSAMHYSSALALACQYTGEQQSDLLSMLEITRKAKLSLVHCSLLEIMYNAGILE